MEFLAMNAIPTPPELAAPDSAAARKHTKADGAGLERADFAAAFARIVAAASGSMHATAATPAEASPSPTDVTRRLEELAPEFRTRLERVIARMEELGHTVQVVETYRDQSRQDFLFEQGRTRPGPVVTWTRDSNHTQGRAADVIVDGSYEGPGYRALHAIARQEGLRTLGARDPGHIELPRDGVLHTQTAVQPRKPVAVVAAAADVAEIAPVARPAQAARVADVAQVAQPAQVAVIAAGGGASTDSGDAATSTSDEPERQDTAAGQAFDAAPPTPREPSTSTPFAAVPPSRDASAIASRAALDRTSDADIASRVARVLELQNAGAAQPLSSVVLKLGGVSEADSLIRVARRGRDITTSIDVADPLRAHELRGRLHELRAAFEAHGLKPEVTVQAVKPGDAADVLADALAALPDAVMIAEATGTKDRGGTTLDQRHDGHRHDADGQPRQRQRRDQHRQEGR